MVLPLPLFSLPGSLSFPTVLLQTLLYFLPSSQPSFSCLTLRLSILSGLPLFFYHVSTSRRNFIRDGITPWLLLPGCFLNSTWLMRFGDLDIAIYRTDGNWPSPHSEWGSYDAIVCLKLHTLVSLKCCRLLMHWNLPLRVVASRRLRRPSLLPSAKVGAYFLSVITLCILRPLYLGPFIFIFIICFSPPIMVMFNACSMFRKANL